MAITTDFKIEGEKKLLRRLGMLADSFQVKAIRTAMRNGAKPVRKAMRDRAPVDRGLLKLAIATKLVVYKQSQTAVGIVGPRYGVKGKKAEKIMAEMGESKAEPAKYMHLVDQGTKPRELAPKNAKALEIREGIFRASASHPGTKGERLVDRSLASSKQKALKEITRSLRESLKKETRGKLVL